MKEIKVRITFTEPILGTSPANPDVYREFIGSKSPEALSVEDEVAALGADAVAEKAMTVFPRTEDGTPFLYDYQIKGMLKDSCKALAAAGKAGYPGGKACAGLKAYKKAIDGLIFVYPREIPYDLHGLKMGYCERPLRASTPQGERVSIAKSESVPAGSTAEFEIECLDPGLEAMVRECLNYGTKRGLGQWRNSGKGRYEWEEL